MKLIYRAKKLTSLCFLVFINNFRMTLNFWKLLYETKHMIKVPYLLSNLEILRE